MLHEAPLSAIHWSETGWLDEREELAWPADSWIGSDSILMTVSVSVELAVWELFPPLPPRPLPRLPLLLPEPLFELEVIELGLKLREGWWRCARYICLYFFIV
jgi:hypothetical protein